MPRHIVVDGSNLATEGRILPSLKQLIDAVMTFQEDHPDNTITVVVDATFGHRIDPSEIAEFEEAIEHNELVAPPAGAVGRGDAFVLSIAVKAKATILSNDSFQEFHGDHPWLFDEGRLIGGKPVPHVGWVFVARTPVRGPISRRSVKDRKGRDPKPALRASGVDFGPMPVPKAPPPRRRSAASPDVPVVSTTARRAPTQPTRDQPTPAQAVAVDKPKAAPSAMVNDLMAFLAFVEHHPVGSLIEATFDSYASHGAYAHSGDVRVYAPMRLLGSPAPRAAREVVKLGDTLTMVVHSFTPSRRSIDVSIPDAAPLAKSAAKSPAVKKQATPRSTAKKVEATGPVPVATKPTKPTTAAPSRPAKPAKKVGVAPAAAQKAVPKSAKPTAGTPALVPAKAAVAPVKKVAAKPVAAVPAKKVAVKPAVAKPVAVKPVAAVPTKKVAVKPAVAKPVAVAPVKTASAKKPSANPVMATSAPKLAVPVAPKVTRKAATPRAAPASKKATKPAKKAATRPF